MTTNSIALNRTLFLEDDLPVFRALPDECVDLASLDPPFDSSQLSAAFGDKGMVRARGRAGSGFPPSRE